MANAEQSKVWNEDAGDAWVTHADHFDATLAPFGEAAIDALAPQPGERIVDVGCGTGATSLRLAALCEPGEVVGVDLSSTMLELARRRAAGAGLGNVRFSVTDVQDGTIDGGPFDGAFSRFGVMFFEDPVAAFANIARSLVAGGRLAFVCFAAPWDNPFITAPVGAAMAALGLPAPAPGGPGPFSLADPDATRAMLTAAGFLDVSIGSGPDEAVLGPQDDLDAIAMRVIAQNPVTSAAFAAADEATRSTTLEAARSVLTDHCVDGLVRMPARLWVVAARRG